MKICPVALAVGCEKCPAFEFCPLTTIFGDQQKEPTGKVWEENFPPEKNKEDVVGAADALRDCFDSTEDPSL